MATGGGAHADELQELRAAADARRAATDRLEGLVVRAARSGVPHIRVAEAAGISRATLYRWIDPGGDRG